MDSEQIEHEMRTTRQRIDQNLDLLQQRIAGAGSQTLRVGSIIAGALAVLVLGTKLYRRRQRRRTRRPAVGWA
jgi:hypothetical protein